MQPGGFGHDEFGKADAVHTASLVAARYRLEEFLASGGMGEVWTAVDELLDRRVALKLLRANLAADDAFRRRFRAEARAAARLSHPGVVSVFDYGEDGQVTYLAMELVDGEPLSEVLRRRGTLTPEETMDLLAQAADALAAAHDRGLVHRDVKPGNLLLRTDGRVKVTDFGIVRATDTTTVTVDGTVLGTVAYMSPEQVRGGNVAPASDIYSLGVVAYECLTGVRPYAASDSIAVALAHLHEPVPELPAYVPAGIRALVTQMLQKDPSERPASASAVARQARALSAARGLPDTVAFDALAGPRASRDMPTAETAPEEGAQPVPAPLRQGRPITTTNRRVSDSTGGPPTRPHTPTALHASTGLDSPAMTIPATQRQLAPDALAPTTHEVLETKPLAGIARAPARSTLPPRAARAEAPRPARHALAVGIAAAVCLLLAFLLATVGAGTKMSSSAQHSAGTVAVPSLVGSTVRTARARLARIGLHASFAGTVPSPGATVVEQVPSPARRVRRGTAVLLRVASASATPTSTTTTTTVPVATTLAPSPAPAPTQERGPGGGDGPGHGVGHGGPGGRGH